jgi:hypothetical protein
MTAGVIRHIGGMVLAIVLGMALSSAAAQELEKVDVELCLAVDGSGSIQEDEFRFQRQAYAAALTHPDVLDIIASGYRGAIAVALMEWGGAESMNPIVGWTRISNQQEAESFAGAILEAPRKAWGWNSISNAIAFCQAWMAENAFFGERLVIDVSGDAGQRGGIPLAVARQEALDAGVVVNALALNYRSGGMTGPGGTPLIEHFRNDVIVGTGAFALEVNQPEEFINALVRKLILEIARLQEAPRKQG